ncbi:MFS transporter [Paenibacillus sp. TAB 01]|uniref:MFS transporter n=1 Tax=Paenibacillus sp. TAB 01 TaxID=3368988 RepID=UPI003752C91B
MLKNRYVRTIVCSRILLQLGIWVRNFAILLYVTDVTGNDPFFVSLISIAEYAPIFIFAFIGGTFADRWLPKRTMVWCDLLSALSGLAVGLVISSGAWHALFIAAFVSSVLSQFSQPSAMKLFKQHVEEERLQGVMAMFQSLMAIFMVIGPVLGTMVYERFGLEASLLIMAVMFMGSALVLSTLPRDAKGPQSQKNGSFREELVAGIRYIGKNRVLRSLGFSFAVSGLAAGCIQPLTVFIPIENLGQDKSFLQWLMMANGFAMLVSGGLIMTAAKKIRPQALLACGLLVSALGTIGVGWSHNTALTILLQIVCGLSYPSIHIGIQTMIIKNTEAAFIGRVGGALTPIFMGMMVVGMSLSGGLKEMTSLFFLFAGSSVLFLIGALLLLPLLKKERASANTAMTR